MQRCLYALRNGIAMNSLQVERCLSNTEL